VLSSGLVRTSLTTFVALLVTWAVTSFQQRKRLAWRGYLDAPVNLHPQQASLSSWKILCQDDEVPDPSLVLLCLRNAGLVEISDDDFRSVLEFLSRPPDPRLGHHRLQRRGSGWTSSR